MALLEEDDISAMIIPSGDPHFGEYVPDYYKCIKWISGFTGSAGTLVVTSEKAALWTDSRYFVQAEKELKGSGIELMKLKMEGTPSISSWLKETLKEDDIVALDEELFSYQDYSKMVEELSPLTPTLIQDPFSSIWEDRPLLEFESITLMEESIAGESMSSKHKRLCEALDTPVPFVYIVSSLDEIAWFCNLRGSDIPYNPLFLSYAVVTREKIVLFLRHEMLSVEAMKYLTHQGVELRDYESFSDYIFRLSDKYIRIFSGNRVTAKNYFSAMENAFQHPHLPGVMSDYGNGGAISQMKAVKNETEIEGFRRANEVEGEAWVKLIKFLEENIINLSEEEYAKRPLTEFDIAEKIMEFRAESPEYLGESFNPIVAYGANAALPHYSASSPEEASVIQKRGFLLVDSGGQYISGTTDTTRTIPVGELSEEERDDYTRVLKGMIALSMAKFPKGTRGAQLDILAREPIFAGGKMYWHGTGHGIGHRLSVHEGPQSIRMEENPTQLLPGMILSNEPGIYCEGSHGIRHENTILVKPWISNEFNEFYEFETLTKIPIDTSVVNFDLLNSDEKEWLKNFNSL